MSEDRKTTKEKLDEERSRPEVSAVSEIEQVRAKFKRPDVKPEDHLYVPPRPGYYRVWKEDDGHTIQHYLDCGFAIVQKSIGENHYTQDKSQLGSAVRITANRQRDAAWTDMVLMEIPQEFADEIFKARELEKKSAHEESMGKIFDKPGTYRDPNTTY